MTPPDRPPPTPAHAAPVLEGRGVRSPFTAAGSVAGCSGIQLGPVQQPEVYPDKSSPPAVFNTFLWAWHTGDVDVLRRVLGLLLLADLSQRSKTQNDKEISAWYRRGAQNLRVIEADWNKRGEALAYLRVLLGVDGEELSLDFSFLRRPTGWVVSGRRILR